MLPVFLNKLILLTIFFSSKNDYFFFNLENLRLWIPSSILDYLLVSFLCPLSCIILIRKRRPIRVSKHNCNKYSHIVSPETLLSVSQFWHKLCKAWALSDLFPPTPAPPTCLSTCSEFWLFRFFEAANCIQSMQLRRGMLLMYILIARSKCCRNVCLVIFVKAKRVLDIHTAIDKLRNIRRQHSSSG